MSNKYPRFSALVGKTLTSVVNDDNTRIVFTTVDDTEYVLFHEQNCCESVYVEDVCGDLNDLVGVPILLAEEVSGDGAEPEGWKPGEYNESYTWTFYKLATIKGSVTIRWYGSSNGYYSEGVLFERV